MLKEDSGVNVTHPAILDSMRKYMTGNRKDIQSLGALAQANKTLYAQEPSMQGLQEIYSAKRCPEMLEEFKVLSFFERHKILDKLFEDKRRDGTLFNLRPVLKEWMTYFNVFFDNTLGSRTLDYVFNQNSSLQNYITYFRKMAENTYENRGYDDNTSKELLYKIDEDIDCAMYMTLIGCVPDQLGGKKRKQRKTKKRKQQRSKKTIRSHRKRKSHKRHKK